MNACRQVCLLAGFLPIVDMAHVRLRPAEQLGREVLVAVMTGELLTPPDVWCGTAAQVK